MRTVHRLQNAVSDGLLADPEGGASPEQAYLELEFSRAWAAYSAESRRAEQKTFAVAAMKAAESLETKFSQQRLDLSTYKNPVRRPQDSQLRVGLLSKESQTLLQIGFLSASHRLEDSSQQSLSEGALQLGDITVLLNPESGEVTLDEALIYSMTSLSPFNTLTGGFTGRIRLGVETHYGRQLEERTALNLSGAVGTTISLSKDALIYGLAAGGLGYAEGGAYPYAEPEIGLIVNEVWGMKSLVSSRLIFNQLSDDELLHELRWTQTKVMGSSFLLVGEYRQLQGQKQLERRVGLSIKRYF